MQEHKRQLPRIDRLLIENVGMIAVVGLPGRVSRFTRIERAGILDNSAANREAALLLDG